MPKRKLDKLGHLQLCSVCDPTKEILTSKFSYLLFFFFFLAPMKEYHCKEKEGNNRDSPPPSYLLFFGTLVNKLKLGVQMDGTLDYP
jgi:hypothetical protein